MQLSSLYNSLIDVKNDNSSNGKNIKCSYINHEVLNSLDMDCGSAVGIQQSGD
jgi:hypothetical protein